MSSWHKSRERWRNRKAPRQNATSAPDTPVDSGHPPTTTGRDPATLGTLDAANDSSSKYQAAFLTATIPRGKPGTPDRSIEAWQRAIASIETTKEWTICCEAVYKRTGATIVARPDQPQDPIQQVADIMLHVSELVSIEAQTQNTKFGKCMNATMATLQFVKDAGAAAAAFNPYAAFGWNIVQFVISIAITDHTVRHEACESLPEVLDRTIRYQTWAKVYDQTQSVHMLTEQLDSVLEDLYTAFLKYQLAVVVSLCSVRARIKVSALGATRSLTVQALDDLASKEKQWSALLPPLDRLITDTRFTELESSLQVLRETLHDDVMVLSQRVDTLLRDQVLSWLSPLRCEDAHNELKRQTVAHTTDWLLVHPEYISWNGNGRANCLWIKGVMGTGKSCIVNAIIKDQMNRCNTSREMSQILYFYCDGSDAERKGQIDDHKKILRSLVKQLVESFSEKSSSERVLPASLLDIYNRQHQKSQMNADQCIQMLLDLSHRSVDLKIIVDGLDECPTSVQDSLIESLERLIRKRATRLRLLVACRQQPELEIALQAMVTGAINMTDHNEDAIRLMIQAKIEECKAKPRKRDLYQTETRDLTTKVYNKVLQNAQGMFRFVQAAFDYLHEAENAMFMEDRLEELHLLSDIGKLYDKNWEDALQRKRPREREVMMTALAFLIYGVSYGIRDGVGSPSATQNSQHILEACTFVYRSTDQLKDRLSVRNVVDTCPSFLIASTSTSNNGQYAGYTSGLTLRIIHVSVTDYLIDRHPEWFSPASANALIATVCMRTFLELSTFPDLARPSPNSLALYAGMCWSEHLRLAQSTMQDNAVSDRLANTLQAFLLAEHCSPAFLRWTALMKQFRRHIVRSGRGPVITNKEEDDIVVVLAFITQPPCSLFARLYFNLQANSFTRSECQNVRTSWEYKSTTVTPQSFAAVMGLHSAIPFLASKGCSPNEQNDRGETSGHVLFREGLISQSSLLVSSVSIFRALIKAKLKLNIRNNEGNTCFFYALRSSFFDKEVLEIFHRAGFNLQASEPCFVGSENSKTVSERPMLSPLKFALAHVPRLASVDVLLSYYASRFPSRALRNTWLFLAVYYHSSPDVVQLLIDKYGADPSLPNEFGMGPLELVMDFGIRKGTLFCPIVDVLAPGVLGPTYDIKAMPLIIAIFYGLVSGCSCNTIKLFVEYVAPIGTGYSLWGSHAITNALLFNQDHGLEIADFLHGLGYRNAGDSHVFQAWKDGTLQKNDVGRGRDNIEGPSKALLEDEASDEEFWDAKE